MSKFENVVDAETAEQDVETFLEENDVLTLDMDAEDTTHFLKQKMRIKNAIMRGHATIDDKGLLTYTPFEEETLVKNPIVFHKRKGGDMHGVDSKKKKDAANTYSIMGFMCRVEPKVFATMVGTDIKVCEAVYALLMD